MPGWLRGGLLGALAHFALGQLRLSMVYRREGGVPAHGWDPPVFC